MEPPPLEYPIHLSDLLDNPVSFFLRLFFIGASIFLLSVSFYWIDPLKSTVLPKMPHPPFPVVKALHCKILHVFCGSFMRKWGVNWTLSALPKGRATWLVGSAQVPTPCLPAILSALSFVWDSPSSPDPREYTPPPTPVLLGGGLGEVRRCRACTQKWELALSHAGLHGLPVYGLYTLSLFYG